MQIVRTIENLIKHKNQIKMVKVSGREYVFMKIQNVGLTIQEDLMATREYVDGFSMFNHFFMQLQHGALARHGELGFGAGQQDRYVGHFALLFASCPCGQFGYRRGGDSFARFVPLFLFT